MVWDGILVNPVLILVKTSGILVSGLGYWVNPVLILVKTSGILVSGLEY